MYPTSPLNDSLCFFRFFTPLYQIVLFWALRLCCRWLFFLIEIQNNIPLL